MKYYIIAGEASGDLHASNLIKSIKNRDKDAHIRAWGGDLMQAQGADIVKHISALAFMGFKEVITNLKTIFENISFCKEDIKAFHPDVIIFIDYPGFNLRICKWAKENNFKTVYYISPQLWAWKEGRVEQVRKYIDKMLVILPFEKDFYHKHNIEVDFVGHPLLDAVDSFQLNPNFRAENGLDFRPIIALLPGSRKQEVSKMLPEMLGVIPQFTDYQFVLACAPSQPDLLYKQIVRQAEVKLVKGQTHQLLANSYAALVTSGTATLETALFNVPEVVCYKGSYFSYFIAKQLVKVKYISLVNLIADKYLVEELIQEDMTTPKLQKSLMKILDVQERETLLSEYKILCEKLGKSGASQRSANIIYDWLSQS